MNNAKNSQINPDLAYTSTFDNGLLIFTTVFFVGLFYWCMINSPTVSTTNPILKSDLVTSTIKDQPVQYSNAFFGLDMNSIESTVKTAINSRSRLSKGISNISDDCNLTTTEIKKETILPVIENNIEPKVEVDSKSEAYILNKSLANNKAVGSFDLLKDIDFSKKAINVEKNDALELVDGSELLMISLNEMHLIKLPTDTDMDLSFIKSDGNEFSAESKVVISAEEKKATLNAVIEVVKGDELAFISEKELDEIKIVDKKSNNSDTKEFE